MNDPSSWCASSAINGSPGGNDDVRVGEEIIPDEFHLGQNFPNPFNPATTISFSLPNRAFVSLRIYDLVGRLVATIVNEEFAAGNYSRQWNAKGFSSGVYFCRLSVSRTSSGTGDMFTKTKKLVLLR